MKQVGKKLPDKPTTNEKLEAGELDELETFVGAKNCWVAWTAVSHFT